MGKNKALEQFAKQGGANRSPLGPAKDKADRAAASKGSKASTPFSTTNGQPQPSPQPADGRFNMNQQNRPQGAATGAAPPVATDVSAQSQRQTMGTIGARVDPRSVPAGGPTPTATAPSYRAGTGSVDASGKAMGPKPFKVSK